LVPFFKTFQSNSEMRLGMPRGALRPTNLSNSVNSVNLVLLSSRRWFAPVEVRTVTFSSDSSRKWQSPWSVAENLSRSWRRAISCSRIPVLGSVSGHHPLSKATLPHCRLTHLAKIEESATRRQSFHQRFLHPDESHPNSC
jgi:hypothetical protein